MMVTSIQSNDHVIDHLNDSSKSWLPFVTLSKQHRFNDIIHILEVGSLLDIQSWLYNPNASSSSFDVSTTALHTILQYHPTVDVVDLLIKRLIDIREMLQMIDHESLRSFNMEGDGYIPENEMDMNGRTPLHIAAMEGCHISIIQRLVLHSIQSVQMKDIYLRYPLHYACLNNNNNNNNSHSQEDEQDEDQEEREQQQQRYSNGDTIAAALVWIYPIAVSSIDHLGMTPIDIAKEIYTETSTIVQLLQNLKDMGIDKLMNTSSWTPIVHNVPTVPPKTTSMSRCNSNQSSKSSSSPKASQHKSLMNSIHNNTTRWTTPNSSLHGVPESQTEEFNVITPLFTNKKKAITKKSLYSKSSYAIDLTSTPTTSTTVSNTSSLMMMNSNHETAVNNIDNSIRSESVRNNNKGGIDASTRSEGARKKRPGGRYNKNNTTTSTKNIYPRTISQLDITAEAAINTKATIGKSSSMESSSLSDSLLGSVGVEMVKQHDVMIPTLASYHNTNEHRLIPKSNDDSFLINNSSHHAPSFYKDDNMNHTKMTTTKSYSTSNSTYDTENDTNNNIQSINSSSNKDNNNTEKNQTYSDDDQNNSNNIHDEFNENLDGLHSLPTIFINRPDQEDIDDDDCSSIGCFSVNMMMTLERIMHHNNNNSSSNHKTDRYEKEIGDDDNKISKRSNTNRMLTNNSRHGRHGKSSKMSPNNSSHHKSSRRGAGGDGIPLEFYAEMVCDDSIRLEI